MANRDVIEVQIAPDNKDLGEFSVGRLLPNAQRQRVGPFIFFDHIGPAEFPPGKGVNVRSHPHIGLATITYLFEGTMLHRDSLGYVQEIRPGEVNWMTAGKGIVHSEKVSADVLANGQRLHGLQTWVALPLEHEETEPRFEHYSRDDIPVVSRDGAEIRVVIGTACDSTSPVQTMSETLYIEIMLEAGASFDLPSAEELAVFVISGEVSIEGTQVNPGVLAVLSPDTAASISAATPAHIMVCGGAALEGERIVWWNFVSSSRERIEQAKQDWREGRFHDVPGEEDFIPLPTDR